MNTFETAIHITSLVESVKQVKLTVVYKTIYCYYCGVLRKELTSDLCLKSWNRVHAFAQKINKTPVEFVKTPDEEPFTNDPVQEHELYAPRINSEAICEECGLELQGNEEYYFKLCERHLTAFKNSIPE